MFYWYTSKVFAFMKGKWVEKKLRRLQDETRSNFIEIRQLQEQSKVKVHISEEGQHILIINIDLQWKNISQLQ